MEQLRPETLATLEVDKHVEASQEDGFFFVPTVNYVGELQEIWQWFRTTHNQGLLAPKYYREMVDPGSAVWRVSCYFGKILASGKSSLVLRSFGTNKCPSDSGFLFVISLSGTGRTKKLAKQHAAKLVYFELADDGTNVFFDAPRLM